MSVEAGAGGAPPTGNPRFPLIDALRAIAVLLVIVQHATLEAKLPVNRLTEILLRGDAGVAVFFVISGFVLYRPFVSAATRRSPRIRTRPYAVRRLLRIVPAYWVALTVLAVYPGLNFVGGPLRYYAFGQVYA